MRWLAGFLLVSLAACNQVLGLEPVRTVDAGRGEVDAGDVDAAPTCASTSGPLPAAGVNYSVGSLLFAVAAAVTTANDVYLVGTHDAPVSDNHDGILLRTGSPTEAYRVGGGLNDQLWSAAASSTQVLAVGLTRSFLGTDEDADQGFLVWRNGDGTLAGRRLYDPSDRSVKLAAAAPAADGGWFVAGRHAGETQVVVARLATNRLATASIAFSTQGHNDYAPRKLLVTATSVIVVGADSQGGFVAALPLDLGSGAWMTTVGADLYDATIIEGQVIAVGRDGSDGVMVPLDLATGAAGAATRFTARPLQRIEFRAGTRWLAGHDSQRIFVGTQRGACLTGAAHVGLQPAAPIAAPVPFTFTSAGAPTIASRVGNGARLVPLSADGAATCGSATFALSGVTETLVTTSVAILTEARNLRAEVVTMAVSNPTVTPTSACP